jgi:hypothetical protein
MVTETLRVPQETEPFNTTLPSNRMVRERRSVDDTEIFCYFSIIRGKQRIMFEGDYFDLR